LQLFLLVSVSISFTPQYVLSLPPSHERLSLFAPRSNLKHKQNRYSLLPTSGDENCHNLNHFTTTSTELNNNSMATEEDQMEMGHSITVAMNDGSASENFVNALLLETSESGGTADLTVVRASSDETSTSARSTRKKLARPTLRARASVSLFALQPSIPEGESPDYWKKERQMLLREMAAEFVGTFLIVFFGTGAVMSAVYTKALVGLFQTAAVWIIGVTMAIATTASISGAHLNPSISLAFVLLRPSRKFGWVKLIPYWLAQLFGSITASWVNYLIYASELAAFEEMNSIVRSARDVSTIAAAKCFGEYYLAPVTTSQAFLVEAFGTAILAAVIFALTHPGNDTMKHNVYIPPLIGMTVGGLISVLAPLTQAGFNPARDFGPRIVAYAIGFHGVAFHQAWLYVLAPLVGAPIGAFLMDKILYAGYEKTTTASTSHE